MMLRRPGIAIALALPTVALLGAGAARAQLLDQFLPPDIAGRGIEPGVTVLSRQRPDFDASGVRAGSFIIRPQLTESVGYESNVRGASRAQGSSVVRTAASVDAESDVSRATVRARLQVDDTRYPELPGQSFTNWSASAFGSHDIGRDTVSASYTHLNLNQTVRDLDVPQLDQAISYRIDTGRLDYRVPINRVFLVPAIEVTNYDYSSGTVAGGTFQQNYRNRVVATPSMTIGYEFSPRRNALLVLRDSIASYSSRAPGLPRRDYNDGAILGGLDYDLNGLIRFRVLGGYELRTFSAAAYKTISAPVVEAAVIWTPTGLTTVTATAQRRIQDSSDENTAGFTETSVRFRVDHEYLRNVLLQANTGIYLGEYGRGGGSQTLYTAGTGADYTLNRNMRLSATYDFASRTSGGNVNNGINKIATTNALGQNTTLGGTTSIGLNGQQFGSGYTDHRILLQLRLQL